jgi:hypothetical protein
MALAPVYSAARSTETEQPVTETGTISVELPPSRAWSRVLAHRHAIALGAIVSASLIFRLHVSSECSLWIDEVSTVQDTYASWPELLRGPSREHPPLMFWLVRIVTEIFGKGDLAVRSVSLGFGCVLLVAIYLLCVELELGRNKALVVVGSFALTPFFVRHATEARMYAMVGALVTLATVYALRLLRGPLTRGALVGFALSSVAAAATHFFALGYALALWGAVVVGTIRRWKFGTLPRRERVEVASIVGVSFALLGLVALDLAGLVRFYSTHEFGGRAAHHFNTQSVWRAFSFVARPRWPLEIEAAISAAGLLLVAVRRRGMAGIVPGALAFTPVAVATLLSSGHMLTPRYLWPSFVFYHVGEVAALLGVLELLARCIVRLGRFARPVSALVWLALLVPLDVRLREYPVGFGAGGANYRGLQAYFRGPRAQDTALVVFVGYAGLRIMGLQYPVPHLMSLEAFEPIPGIRRYLIAEFHASDPRLNARLFPLLKRHFGLSRAAWRALRPVPLPGTRYQPPPRARLVILDPVTPTPEGDAPTGSNEGDTARMPEGSGDGDED